MDEPVHGGATPWLHRKKKFLLEVTGVDILRYKVVAVVHGMVSVGVLFCFLFFCFLQKSPGNVIKSRRMDLVGAVDIVV